MTPQSLALATVAMAAAGYVQGSIGFGLGLLTAAILALIDPAFVPGPLLLASLPLSFLVVLREYNRVDRPALPWLIAGRVPGTALGAKAVALASHRTLGLLIGLSVLAAVVASLGISARRVQRLMRSRRALVTAGVASGFMGTAASIGGPPVALLYQHESGPKARSTLAAIFVVGTILSLVGLAIAGRFGTHEIRLAAFLIPGTTVGFLLSRLTLEKVDRGRLRPLVLGVASAAAATLLAVNLV